MAKEIIVGTTSKEDKGTTTATKEVVPRTTSKETLPQPEIH